MRGTFRLAITVDGVRYKLPVGGYSITSAVVRGETVPILNVWIASADAQTAGLPAGSTLKGKLATRPRFFQQVAGGQFQRIAMSDILISGIAGAGTGSIVLQLNLGGQDLELGGQDIEVTSPRDAASGQAAGYTGRTLKFSGKPLELGGNDWE